MNNTRANVEERAIRLGLEYVQIDGIPEGFSFKRPDIHIGNAIHKGEYVLYVPGKVQTIIRKTKEELLQAYERN